MTNYRQNRSLGGRKRPSARLENTLIKAGMFVAGVVLLAVVVGTRYLFAAGEWACVFANDPSLCAAVVTK